MQRSCGKIGRQIVSLIAAWVQRSHSVEASCDRLLATCKPKLHIHPNMRMSHVSGSKNEPKVSSNNDARIWTPQSPLNTLACPTQGTRHCPPHPLPRRNSSSNPKCPKSSTQSDCLATFFIIFFSWHVGGEHSQPKIQGTSTPELQDRLPAVTVGGSRLTVPIMDTSSTARLIGNWKPWPHSLIPAIQMQHKHWANQLIATEWHIHVHNLLQEGVAASVHLDQCLQMPKKSGKVQVVFMQILDCIQIPKLQKHLKVSYHLPIVQQPLTDLILALWYDTGPYQLSMFGNSPEILPPPMGPEKGTLNRFPWHCQAQHHPLPGEGLHWC